MKNTNNDRIEQTDFLHSYWLAAGGTTMWMYERANQIFVAIILSNSREMGIHFPADDERLRTDTIVRMSELLGFREIPVMKKWANVINFNVGKHLREQWATFDESMDQAIKDQAAKENPQAETKPSKIVTLGQ